MVSNKFPSPHRPCPPCHSFLHRFPSFHIAKPPAAGESDGVFPSMTTHCAIRWSGNAPFPGSEPSTHIAALRAGRAFKLSEGIRAELATKRFRYIMSYLRFEILRMFQWWGAVHFFLHGLCKSFPVWRMSKSSNGKFPLSFTQCRLFNIWPISDEQRLK